MIKRLTLARVMARSLLRDKGALAMAFVMPPAVFVIFALIFSRAGGADIQVGLAVADLAPNARSATLVQSIKDVGTLRMDGPVLDSRTAVEAALRRGAADAGLIINKPRPGGLAPELTVLVSPSREIAGIVVEGTVQELLLREAPGMAQVLPITRQSVGPEIPTPVSIPYYAAAVALLFLLLGAMQGAVSLHEEREGGIFDRMSGGPAGVGPLIDGKFLFLTLQGVVQVALIFAAAWVGFGVVLEGVWGLWAVTTVLCAAAAAGLGLFFVSLCRTRRQALTVGNIMVLILSALGGSMIPRFLMPVEMQNLGWLTPNTWGLEAYATFLWRGEGTGSLVLPWALLSLAALAGIFGTRLVVRRWA